MVEAAFNSRRRRLAACLGQLDGITLDQAMAQVERNLESVRDETLGEIDQAISGLMDLSFGHAGTPDPDALARMHAACATIFGLAGMFGMEPLSRAARLFGEFLDSVSHGAAWDPKRVQLLCAAVRCLRRDGNRCEAARMLEGLEKIMPHSPPDESFATTHAD